MKKLFSIIAILMMAMTAWADELTVVEVTTWQGIQDYLKSSDRYSKTCRLMADIDFEGGAIQSLDEDGVEFSCIDGNNHTIKNGTLAAGYMFRWINEGTIKNLKFEGISSAENIIVSNAQNGCHFENLSFNKCHITGASDYAALVCGVAFYTAVANYHAEDNVPLYFSNITVTNCDVKGDRYVGTILGSTEYSCNVTNCYVTGTAVQGNTGVGGILGGSISKGYIDNCSFGGTVFANGGLLDVANCGGIVGVISKNGKILNCVNNGNIEADEDQVGGIAGYAQTVSITNCKNTGWIHHKELTGADDEIGGILGYGLAVQISKCVNAGSIDGGDDCAGGIAGFLRGDEERGSSSITNCVNGAFVNGNTHVGGIAGQIIGTTTVSYCIGASNRIEGNEHVQILVGEEPSGSTHDNYWISDESNIEVGAVTETDLISGKVTWHINQKLGTSNAVWTQNIGTDLYPVIGDKGIHHARTMSNEWGTIVLPFKVYYNTYGINYRLYKLSEASVNGNEGTLTLTEYGNDYIPAGTPMVVRKVSGEGIDILSAGQPDFNTTITPQTSTNASLPAGWTMDGTFTNLTEQTGIYYIANNQFWWAESPITIAPFRAWFTGPAPTNSGAPLRIVEGDGSETSTIGEIMTDGSVNFYDTPIYNIQGQRQQVGQKGLQIRGGRVILNY